MNDKYKNEQAGDKSIDGSRPRDGAEAVKTRPEASGEGDDVATDGPVSGGAVSGRPVNGEDGDATDQAEGDPQTPDVETDTLAMVQAAMASGARESEADEAAVQADAGASPAEADTGGSVAADEAGESRAQGENSESPAQSGSGEAAVDEPPPPLQPPPPPPQQPPPPPPKRSSGVAWLALLLVFALGGAAGWYYQQTQLREAALLERLAYLEDTAAAMNVPAPEPEGYATEQALASVASEARQLDSRTRELDDRTRQLEAVLKDLQDRPAPEAASAAPAIDTEALTRDWESRLSDAIARVEAINRRQEQQLETLSGEVGVLAQQPQVNIDRDAWQLAEVEYLLRLANQRMIMAGDTETAGALLSSADKILQELDDIAMVDVRRALAEDLAAIQAVPRLDVEGMYLKLAALIGQADALVIFELPDTLESVEPVAPETWQERLMAGWQRALDTLSSYIVVRRRDTSAEALMDPQWERMVRQNLRMLLEESQVALLSGNQLLFEESLQRTLYWVEEFFISDEAAARALHADLTSLMEKSIAVKLPDISGSMLAFDRAMARKLALSEANN